MEYIEDALNTSRSIVSDSYNSDDGGNNSDDELMENDGFPSLYVKPQYRHYNDTLFTILYLVAFLTMMIYGIILMMTPSNVSVIAKSLFRPLWQSSELTSGLLIQLVAASLVVSLIWISLLARYSKSIMVVTAILLPISIIATSVGVFVKFTTLAISNTGERTEFTALASIFFASIFGGLYTAWIAYKSRKMLSVMSGLIELSTEILGRNLGLFVLSTTLSLAHLSFSILWLSMFAHIFLGGTVIPDGSVALDPQGPYLAIFFVLMYFWTSAMLQNIQKATVASVVGEFYFDRSNHMNSTDESWFHFRFVTLRSFGTISFASLILGLIRSLQFLVNITQRYAPKALKRTKIVALTINFLTHLIEQLDSYTVVVIGLAGDSLFVSGSVCTKLFQRNLVLGLMTSTLTRTLSFVGKIFVSTVIGILVFWRSTSISSTGQEWITFFVAAGIPYYVLSILTGVIESTIDATFVCYLVDLDNHSCNYEKAYDLFEYSLK